MPRHEPVLFRQETASIPRTKASELKMKNAYTERPAAELEAVAGHNLCAVQGVRYTFPFHSNGNCLRRWLTVREVEMPEVSVEFQVSCPFRVTVRRLPSGDWRVLQLRGACGVRLGAISGKARVDNSYQNR